MILTSLSLQFMVLINNDEAQRIRHQQNYEEDVSPRAFSCVVLDHFHVLRVSLIIPFRYSHMRVLWP